MSALSFSEPDCQYTIEVQGLIQLFKFQSSSLVTSMVACRATVQNGTQGLLVCRDSTENVRQIIIDWPYHFNMFCLFPKDNQSLWKWQEELRQEVLSCMYKVQLYIFCRSKKLVSMCKRRESATLLDIPSMMLEIPSFETWHYKHHAWNPKTVPKMTRSV